MADRYPENGLGFARPSTDESAPGTTARASMAVATASKLSGRLLMWTGAGPIVAAILFQRVFTDFARAYLPEAVIAASVLIGLPLGCALAVAGRFC
jgi:hypothetical protein